MSVFAATVVVGLCVRAVRADDDTVFRRWFSLRRLDAYVEFESQFDQARVRYDDRGPFGGDRRQTNRDWRLDERLGFALDGYVVDPELLAFRGDFSFGLTQDHYDEQGPSVSRSDSEWGHLLNFDFQVDILRGKPLSGSVYGARGDDRISRRFQVPLRERRTGVGTSWYYASDTLPMELRYDYRETDRTGNADPRDDEKFTDSSLYYAIQWLGAEDQRFKLSYEHANIKQEYQGSTRPFETTRDLWVFEHEWAFGVRRQHDLRTLIHWQEESGDFARDLFEFTPSLTLRHSDHFRTMYRYEFSREDYEHIRVSQHRAEIQFTHQLHSNLVTTGHLFGLYEKTSDDVETTQYGAGIDWQYNRRNPFGHFYANLAVGFDNERARGDNGRRLVLNESGTFRDPLHITLRNRNVIRTSVVVTDASNRRVYVNGVDYTLLGRGVWTQIVRVQTGRIADLETVLVDYEFATPADGKIDTLRADFSTEQRFSGGLTPYYSFSYRNQEVDYSVGFDIDRDRTDHHRIGLKYEQPRFQVGGEFELFDDTVEPYDAFHIDGRYALVQAPEQSVDGAVRFSRFFFDGGVDDRNVSLLDVELDHRWRISDAWSSTSRIMYRWEDDSVAGHTNGVDCSTALTYALGDLSIELSVDYDLLALPDSKEDGFGVWLTVRRDIRDLLGPRAMARR
jgi:hypothetical protein